MDQAHIKQVARDLAKSQGLANMTKAKLCQALGIPVGSLAWRLGYSYGALIKEISDGVPAYVDGVPIKAARLAPELRKEALLVAARDIALTDGFKALTRVAISDAADVSNVTSIKLFKTVDALVRALVGKAIADRDAPLLAKALEAGHPRAKKAPADLLDEALDLIPN